MLHSVKMREEIKNCITLLGSNKSGTEPEREGCVQLGSSLACLTKRRGLCAVLLWVHTYGYIHTADMEIRREEGISA